MRATEFLTELADKPYEILFSQHKAQASRYDFATDNDAEYMVLIKPTMHGQAFQNNALQVDFAMRKNGEYDDSANGLGGASALRVFTTVLHTLKDSLQHRINAGLPIQYIVFAGRDSEPSRVALYSRFAKSIGRFLPGWQFESAEQGDDHTKFIVKKVSQ